MKSKEEIINDSIKIETPSTDYNLLEIQCFLALKQLLIMYHNNQISKENATKNKQLILADYEKQSKQYEFERKTYKEHIEHIKNTEEARCKLHKLLNIKNITKNDLCEIVSTCIEIIRNYI